jgi:hypothetical protein
MCLENRFYRHVLMLEVSRKGWVRGWVGGWAGIKAGWRSRDGWVDGWVGAWWVVGWNGAGVVWHSPNHAVIMRGTCSGDKPGHA